MTSMTTKGTARGSNPRQPKIYGRENLNYQGPERANATALDTTTSQNAVGDFTTSGVSLDSLCRSVSDKRVFEGTRIASEMYFYPLRETAAQILSDYIGDGSADPKNVLDDPYVSEEIDDAVSEFVSRRGEQIRETLSGNPDVITHLCDADEYSENPVDHAEVREAMVTSVTDMFQQRGIRSNKDMITQLSSKSEDDVKMLVSSKSTSMLVDLTCPYIPVTHPMWQDTVRIVQMTAAIRAATRTMEDGDTSNVSDRFEQNYRHDISSVISEELSDQDLYRIHDHLLTEDPASPDARWMSNTTTIGEKNISDLQTTLIASDAKRALSNCLWYAGMMMSNR